MPHIIEPAKSGRASCRTCRSPIAKGELRFGEEVPNAFAEGETTHQWHHLACAAKKKASQLREAMASYEGEIPNKAEIEGLLAAGPAKGEKPASYPYAERASTGRAKCQECDEAIAKGELRVAIEREVDTGSFMRKGAGYLHPACAVAHTGEDGLFAQVKANTGSTLTADDLAELEEAMSSGAGVGDDDDDDMDEDEDEDEQDEDGDDDE